MNKPRILIVTYNWPPRNAIGTHRPYTWAKYWSEAGAQVTVLTAVKQDFDAPLDLNLCRLDKVKLIEVPYGGVSLSFLNRIVRNKQFLLVLKKIKAHLRKNSLRTNDPRATWRKAARPHIERLAKENDIIVSTFGPAASHLIAYDGKVTNPQLKWVADYRDLWSQNYRQNWTARTRQNIRSLEQKTVGQNADLVTTVSDHMILELEDFSTSKPLKVTNGFDLNESELKQIISSVSPRTPGPVRVVYTGTVYPGHQDPTLFLEAVARMIETGKIDQEHIVVEFYGSRVEPINLLMRNPRFRPFLRTPGHVTRDDALRIQRDADILLLLESSSPEARGVLTGKVFEYISSGRPIICIGSRQDFEIGALLERTGTGIVVNGANADAIIQSVSQFLEGKKGPSWFSPQLDEIMHYSRERQAQEFLKRIQALI